MVHDLKHRLHRNSLTAERPVCQHIAVVRFKAPGDPEPLRTVVGHQPPLKLPRAGEPQVEALMRLGQECCPIFGMAPAFDVVRRSTEHAPHVGDLANAQVAVFGIA